MNDGIKVLVRVFVRNLAPYYDVRARRRVRQRATRLVSWEVWPEDDATPTQLAELALVRLLWLQRSVHVASRLRQRDATALLARASIETCLTGMWCLHDPESVTKMTAQTAWALQRMVRYLIGTVVSAEFVDRAIAVVGEPERPTPTSNMKDAIVAATENDLMADLHDRFYVPASIMYAHAGGPALMRHVRKRGAPSQEPTVAWLRRSACHIADGCVALLALAVATAQGSAADPVIMNYAEQHLVRAMPLITSMGGSGTLRSLDVRALPEAIRSYRRVQRYFQSDQYRSDGEQARERVVRPAVLAMTALFHTDDDDKMRPLFVEELIMQLCGHDMDRDQSPSGTGQATPG